VKSFQDYKCRLCGVSKKVANVSDHRKSLQFLNCIHLCDKCFEKYSSYKYNLFFSQIICGNYIKPIHITHPYRDNNNKICYFDEKDFFYNKRKLMSFNFLILEDVFFLPIGKNKMKKMSYVFIKNRFLKKEERFENRVLSEEQCSILSSLTNDNIIGRIKTFGVSQGFDISCDFIKTHLDDYNNKYFYLKFLILKKMESKNKRCAKKQRIFFK